MVPGLNRPDTGEGRDIPDRAGLEGAWKGVGRCASGKAWEVVTWMGAWCDGDVAVRWFCAVILVPTKHQEQTRMEIIRHVG